MITFAHNIYLCIFSLVLYCFIYVSIQNKTELC